MHSVSKHTFSLYVSNLRLVMGRVDQGDSVTITDAALCHRIARVLRLRSADTFFLFDGQEHALLVLHAVHKQTIEVVVRSVNKTESLQPHITFALPVLKRDALESAIYLLTELGINHIQLLVTEKVHNYHDKDFERYQRIAIAAAEQAKQFNVTSIAQPVKIGTFLEQLGAMHNESRIFFDPAGIHVEQILHSLSAKKRERYILMIGPEGDLTAAEKQQLAQASFQVCALTPTILKAEHAAMLGAGIFRSVFY